MLIEGLISQVPVWDIVSTAYRNRLDGILTLRKEATERILYLKHGQLVFARSNVLDERLGEKLVRWGHLTYRDLYHCSRLIRPGRRLGMILVEQGLLTPDQLVRAVYSQVRDIVWSAFAMDDGQFIYERGTYLPSEVITLNIPMPLLIFQAIMQIPSWTIIQRSIGPLTTVYLYDEDQSALVRILELEQAWEQLLQSMRSPTPLETILQRSPFSDFETGRFITAMLALKVVHRLDQPETAFEILIHGESRDDTAPMSISEPVSQDANLDLSFSDLADLVDQGGLQKETLRYLPRFQPPENALERFRCRYRYLWTIIESIYGSSRARHEVHHIIQKLILERPTVWFGVTVDATGELNWSFLRSNLICFGQRPYSEELEPFIDAMLHILRRSLLEPQLKHVQQALDRILSAHIGELVRTG